MPNIALFEVVENLLKKWQTVGNVCAKILLYYIGALRIYTWSFLSIGQILMVKKDIAQTDIEIGWRKFLYELI